MKEYVILKLRLKSGINKNEFKEKFNIDIYDIFNTEFTSLKNDNLVIEKEDRIYLSKRGEEVANIVWEMFV